MSVREMMVNLMILNFLSNEIQLIFSAALRGAVAAPPCHNPPVAVYNMMTHRVKPGGRGRGKMLLADGKVAVLAAPTDVSIDRQALDSLHCDSRRICTRLDT